ncbi:ttudgA-like protein [Caudoviricetes sp.]|nr:ttudgA-like protein [Caudoviricetes sp.]UOF81853.1 ttudgA-like protein [Caudoviricetes sp.]
MSSPTDYGCDCAHCPFAKNGQPANFVMPVGPNTPDGILVVGGGPTRDDVKQGEVINPTSPTGRELEQVLAEAGLARDRLLVVASWACQGHEPKKEVEERAATIACRPLVAKTLTARNSLTPVLLCGKWAKLSVAGKEEGLFANRGFRDDNWRIPSEHAQGGSDRSAGAAGAPERCSSGVDSGGDVHLCSEEGGVEEG